MSLRYTGEATMDEPALRDVERWKDKIEVRLDNRQVFFLFFGSAMVACMLFVLGVIVGKRLESRGRAEAPVIEDPLAALDRFGDRVGAPTSAPLAAPALTFPHALIGNNTAAKNERFDRLDRKQTTLTSALPAPVATAPISASSSPAAAKNKKEKAALLPRPLPALAPAPAVASTTPASAPKAPVKVTPATPVTTAAKASASKSVGLASAKVPPAAVHADKAKANFLLQLSSFQDRSEADAFARRFSAQNAYVVASEVPGKGLWYRVRVGSYGNLKEATAAKTNFEHDHGVIAYVAGSGPAQ
jgi:DedD protein